ncbi:MAG: ATP-binding protein [Anaeromyxobacter sp.]
MAAAVEEVQSGPVGGAALREAEAAAARLARLQAATAALSRARTPDEVAEVAIAAACEALGGSGGALLVPDAVGVGLDVLRCVRWAEPALRALAGGRPDNPVDEVWRTGASVTVKDRTELWSRYPGLATLTDPVPGAIAAVPMAVEGRPLGVLLVAMAEGTRVLPEDRAFAEALASQCAQAYERARLFVAERVARAEAVAAQRRLSFLDGLSTVLVDTFDEAVILDSLVRLSVPALGAWAAVYTPGDQGPVVRAEAGDPGLGERARSMLQRDARARLAGAVGGGPAGIIEAAPRDPRAPLSLALVGLGARGEGYGALAVASGDDGRRYGSADLALFSDAARRTAMAIEHARLYRAAQQAAQAREDFLHVASHELRGPLGTLRLTVQLLGRDLRGEDRSRTEERIRITERQAERLIRLSDALLDVSRITAGKVTLHKEQVDLAELGRECATRVAEEAAEAGCALTLDVAGPAPCKIDPARMDQVVSNLLSNAIKYGRGSPVEVRVRAEHDRVRLDVVDHGIGIAPEDQARIFGRFERAVSPRNFGGLGLGLWIARSLVEAHGGRIGVLSAPGHGATFTVDLPAQG